MVLELINQLSAEEGFVTVVLSEDGQHGSTLTSAMQKSKIRRLSLHNNSIESYMASPKAGREQLSKVRSLDIFGKVKSIPPLSSFGVLRVLQVDDCSGLDNHHLNDLGKLRLLRFLRLQGLEIKELPESIGELESLETLDIRNEEHGTRGLLPVSLAKLRKLVRLLATGVELPHGLTLENMTSLRELVGIRISLHAATEIPKLRELKVLVLYMFMDEPCYTENERIVKCLQLCSNLEIFITRTHFDHHYPVDLVAKLPSSLRTFTGAGWFAKAFPKWNKGQLSYLTILDLGLINVRVLPEHLEQLSELPSLRFLLIESRSTTYLDPSVSINIPKVDHEQEKLSSASGFPCLTYLDLSAHMLFLKFEQGAMPKLQKLRLSFDPIKTNKHFRTSIIDSGLENLPSLCHVIIELWRHWVEEENLIRKAVNDHPNHPSLDLS